MSSPLVRKLRREVKANPLKASILAILFVVAIWFWIPLVQKWCGSTPASTAGPNGFPVAASPDGSAAVGGVVQGNGAGTTVAVATPVATAILIPETKNKAATFSWQIVASQLERDSRMAPVVDLGKWRDPFGPSAGEVAAAAEKQEAAERLAAKKKIQAARLEELTPAGAGLTLTSTIVRPQRSVALINGQVYYEGSFVPANDGDGGFSVVDILPRQIVLERQGKRYQLGLKSVEIARKDAGAEIPASRDRQSSKNVDADD